MRENFGYVNAYEDKNPSTFIVDDNRKNYESKLK